jgi:hypothetical protein
MKSEVSSIAHQAVLIGAYFESKLAEAAARRASGEGTSDGRVASTFLSRVANFISGHTTYSATFAIFLMLGRQVVHLSHDTASYQPMAFASAFANAAAPDPRSAFGASFAIEEESTGLRVATAAHDYLHRPPALRRWSPYLIATLWQKSQLRGAKGHDGERSLLFAATHPQCNTHVLRLRAHAVVPQLTCTPPPRPHAKGSAGDKHTYAVFALGNYAAWLPSDLDEEHPSARLRGPIWAQCGDPQRAEFDDPREMPPPDVMPGGEQCENPAAAPPDLGAAPAADPTVWTRLLEFEAGRACPDSSDGVLEEDEAWAPMHALALRLMRNMDSLAQVRRQDAYVKAELKRSRQEAAEVRPRLHDSRGALAGCASARAIV